jgi:hypothetical protein
VQQLIADVQNTPESDVDDMCTTLMAYTMDDWLLERPADGHRVYSALHPNQGTQILL